MRPIRLPWAMLAVCTLGIGKTDPYTYLHHPVSTDIQAAQFAFDRGLTMVLAYEQDEGERAFREAARLDPSLAMAWWGIALAVGPNINYPPDKKNTGIAVAAVERARRLAAKHAGDLQPPIRTALAFTCRLDLSGLPESYAGGFLVSSTLAPLLGANQPPDAHVPGYLSTSVVTVRLWKKADATQGH
jgi:hypothetical protein